MYATYLTTYRGNKLPPFYIGHAKVESIENGYLGSVGSKKYKRIWLHEIKENIGLFKIQIIKRFGTKAEALIHERKLQLQFSVHTNPMYINRAVVNEKFFAEKGTKWSKPMNAETKEKLRQITKKQFLDPIQSEKHRKSCDGHKGRIWINDGTTNKRIFPSEMTKYEGWIRGRLIPKETAFWNYDKTGENNPFFGKKHSTETKLSISETMRKK